jgi:hypothetical protein
MLAHISPAIAAVGGVLPPRLRRMSAGNPAQCARHFLRRSILASDTEQLGDLPADRSTAS